MLMNVPRSNSKLFALKFSTLDHFQNAIRLAVFCAPQLLVFIFCW